MSKEKIIYALGIITIAASASCGNDTKAARKPSALQPTEPKSTSGLELIPPNASQTPQPPTQIWTAKDTATPVPVQTDIPKPTRTPNPTETRIATQTKKPERQLPYQKYDLENLNKIRILREGDQVILVNPLIEYIFKVPRPLISDAVFGILANETDKGIKGIAIVENLDCEFASLSENNQLGNPKFSDRIEPFASGLWQSHVRLTELKLTSYVEYSMGTIPVLTSESFTGTDGNEIVCPKKSAFDGLGGLSYSSGELLGSTIKEFIEGLDQGFFEE